MNAKIVIVEDNEVSSLILKKSFRKINYLNVDCYNNAVPFLKDLHSSNVVLPKVVILDYHLPVMNGFQVLAYLKRNEVFSNIPVILYSGIADEHEKRTSLKAGALDFVEKIYNEEVLNSFVCKVRELAKTGVYKKEAN